jgi:hypothetical protein
MKPGQGIDPRQPKLHQPFDGNRRLLPPTLPRNYSWFSGHGCSGSCAASRPLLAVPPPPPPSARAVPRQLLSSTPREHRRRHPLFLISLPSPSVPPRSLLTKPGKGRRHPARTSSLLAESLPRRLPWPYPAPPPPIPPLVERAAHLGSSRVSACA